jgi:hypothetical protein
VEANVELREMEAEQLDSPAERRQPAVGDPPGSVRAQAPVEDVEVGGELGR